MHRGYELKPVVVSQDVTFKVLAMHGYTRGLRTQKRFQTGLRLFTGALLAKIGNHWCLVSVHVSYLDIIKLGICTNSELVDYIEKTRDLRKTSRAFSIGIKQFNCAYDKNPLHLPVGG